MKKENPNFAARKEIRPCSIRCQKGAELNGTPGEKKERSDKTVFLGRGRRKKKRGECHILNKIGAISPSQEKGKGGKKKKNNPSPPWEGGGSSWSM